MRYLFLACLPLLPFAAACGSARAEGPDAGPLPMDVAGLAARLVAAEARIAALEARKVPHLVVAATGEDLGVSLGGTCAWNDPAGGEACFRYVTLNFEGPDCTGTAYASIDSLRPSARLPGHRGTWLKYAGGAPVNVAVASQFTSQYIKCGPAMNTVIPSLLLADTGVPSRTFTDAQLSIVLR